MKPVYSAEQEMRKKNKEEQKWFINLTCVEINNMSAQVSSQGHSKLVSCAINGFY